MGTNTTTIKDEGTCEALHKHVKREHNKRDEIFHFFANKEKWNKMCIENNISDQQVVDEETNDEEKEQDKSEPIADVG